MMLTDSNRQDRRRSQRVATVARISAPLLLAIAVIAAWELLVWFYEVPQYQLPAPSAILQTLFSDWAQLGTAWLVTLRTMLIALLAAILGGVLLAMLFVASPAVELSLFPYAVILQVTPLVAIAPLLMVWIESTWLVLLLCAWIVAFFPILASTTIGLKSADPGLRDLFDLYGASHWQRIRLLLVPSALPYFLSGLRIAVNLSLVGAVVAEFVTGASGAQSGLASVIFEGTFRLDTPKMFAALGLVSLTGIVSYFATNLLSNWLLAGWHESDA